MGLHKFGFHKEERTESNFTETEKQLLENFKKACIEKDINPNALLRKASRVIL